MDEIEIARSSYNVIQNEPKTEDHEKDSVENFQKFFYDLFEKNGILNDLRAYLRRHIVEVLKNSNAGDTPMCQKHFSQRLELKAQAINILVAEYLLHSEFNYTLSVFVSEIPLANMLFDFAGSLMKGDGQSELYFRDKDIWSIIHYLGIKCDSKLVTNIAQTYKNEKQPLLLCIIKSLPMIPVDVPCGEPVVSSSEEVLSEHSSDTMSEKTSKKFAKFAGKCQHYALCRSCHYKVMRLKEKYKKRKDSEKLKESSQISMNVNSLMKNISKIEGTLVNEMFDQLKTVYETELDMMRAKQERRVQQTLQEHAQNMQQQRQELEQAFKAREEDLERGVRAKKKFLWGLARSLRAQHEHLARAMLAVKCHTLRLKDKEDNLKAQLIEVEHLMQTRGEDMQVQISTELIALQRQLDNVKMEREAVNKEKAELEHLRHEITTNHANIDVDEIGAISDSAWATYGLMKSEISILRKINEVAYQDKCMTEQNAVTDANVQSTRSTEVLNNEQEVKVVREEDKRLKNNQLVNDFKKKNVNFSMGNVEETFMERHCPTEDPRQADDKTISQLSQENERLREYARQQEQQVAALNERATRLQLELSEARTSLSHHPPRPRTAPLARTRALSNTNSTNEIACKQLSWRRAGAGEDTNLLKCAPQVYLPGDTVPFIGLLYDRHAEPKRLMNQWRCARRSSPLRAHRAASPRPATAPAPAAPRPATTPAVAAAPLPAPESTHSQDTLDKTYPDEPSAPAQNEHQALSEQKVEMLIPDLDGPMPQAPPTTPLVVAGAEARARSPKSLLRDAKEKLRAYPNSKKYFVTPPPSTSNRDESPTTVLREAKLRLRKLEIEADAVEKSYMDYKKRQDEMRSERELNSPVKEEPVVTKDVEHLTSKIVDPLTGQTQNSIKKEIHAFLQEYRRKLNLTDQHFSNITTAAKIKPIPESFSPVNLKNGKGNGETVDYLEPPLSEFQKYYKSNERLKPKTTDGDQEVARNKHRPALRPFGPLSITPNPSPQDPSPHRSLDPIPTGDSLATEVKQLEAKKDALIKAKNSKKVELEILKSNVTKMYNYDDDIERKEEDVVSQDIEDAEPAKEEDTHSLTIEVENIKETHEIKVEAELKHLLLVVKSNVDVSEDNNKLHGNMTVLISPKRSPTYLDQPKQKTPRSVSPEQAAKLTRNDVLEAIFQNPVKVTSNEEVGEVESKNGSEEGSGSGEEYRDDFSADVDNYDYSRTDCSRSPNDLATHEPDDLWDDSNTYP